MSKMVNHKNETYFCRLKRIIYNWYLQLYMFYTRYIKLPFFYCCYNKIPPVISTSTHHKVEDNIPVPISESIEDELVITRKTSHSDINNTHEISLHTTSISKNIDPTYIEQTN
jgi:hypothetical protein